ncbi:hypothetical protein [Frondihabitans cladoniiphilus]|uniref:Uncharacterized protein n=1 Tax=Frondihabitans cladoniiphilus TaxID=715785 RepID=A0ABP8W8C8_9MICO
MPETTPPADELMNELWLQSEHAIHLARAAEEAAQAVDRLVRTALDAGAESDVVAAAAFMDVELIRRIAGGSTTSEYLRERGNIDAGSAPGSRWEEQPPR